MPSSENTRLRRLNARSLRNLVDYNLKNNALIKFQISEDALIRGVTRERGRSKLSAQAYEKSLKTNERKRLEEIRALSPIERSTVAGIQTMVTLLTECINENIQSRYKLLRGDVGRALNQPRDRSLIAPLRREARITIEVPNRSDEKSRDGKRRDKARVPFHWLMHRKELRDPSKAGSGDPIHLGAHPTQKWYAITQLSIFGKKVAAGRKGTPFQGLGYQPLGANKKNQSFIRVGYPGRSRPDRLTTQHQYSLFSQYWRDRKRADAILVPIKDQMVRELNLYIAKWKGGIKTSARIASSRR